MKLKSDYISEKTNIENTNNCKILRCIYHFYDLFYDTYCLIRIYEFKSKTIVLASQLFGAILWDSFLIKDVINDFNLNHENLYWINHYGLFSNVVTEEKFLHTTFSYKKESIFSSKEVDLEQETEVSIKFVEDLIESPLEPVELWLGLDLVAENKFIRIREEKAFELLYQYLKDNIEHLYKQQEIIDILGKSRPGAIFFYPNQPKNFEFIDYGELLHCNDDSRKKALAYIDKSFLDEEVVICICIGNLDPFCTILRKDFFVNPARINFLLGEKLVELEIQSLASDMVKFDVDRYRKKIELGKERLESLLQLYLEPKFERLKFIFEQMESARSHLETQRGALFYYPEHDQCVFSTKQLLTSAFEMSAIPYVDTYDIETEVVFCFSIYNKLSVCGIFPKS